MTSRSSELSSVTNLPQLEAATSESRSKIKTRAFVSLVRRCGENPHYMARAASARALAALVPSTQAADTVLELLQTLPENSGGMRFSEAGSADGRAPAAHNRIHGEKGSKYSLECLDPNTPRSLHALRARRRWGIPVCDRRGP